MSTTRRSLSNSSIGTYRILELSSEISQEKTFHENRRRQHAPKGRSSPVRQPERKGIVRIGVETESRRGYSVGHRSADIGLRRGGKWSRGRWRTSLRVSSFSVTTYEGCRCIA